MQDQNERKELFETMPIPKAVASMCIPTIIGSVVMMLYNLADTYFVGALNSPVQSAAVTLAAPVLLAFNAVNNLFGTGTSSLMSRSLGLGDFEKARRTSAFGFYGTIICGALFSAICTLFKPQLLNILGADADTAQATSEYLFWTVTCGAVPSMLNVVMGFMVKSEGAALHASIGTMSGCVLNIILDPFFILPKYLGMGAAGAGLATFISNCVAVLYFVILIAFKGKRTFCSVDPRKFRPEGGLAKDVCSVGVPASIQNLLNVTGQTVLNNFASVFGAAAVSAVGISHKIIMIPIMVGMGISSGIMPLVGYNYSQKNYRRMKDVSLFTFKISIGLMLVLMVFLLAFAGPVMTAFIKVPEIIDYGTVLLRLGCIILPFMMTDFGAVGVFQACGMGKRSLVFAILRKVVLEIPALFIWNKVWPMYGLGLAAPTSEIILAIAAVITVSKIFSLSDEGKS